MSHIYEFGNFQIDIAEETLHQNGEKININRRTFQVLRLLVERAGEIVSKQDFFDTVWADTFVEDNSLTVTMTTLRKILGDNAKQAKFIENLPRKGYRFIGKVEVVNNAPPIEGIEEKSENLPATNSSGKSISQNRKIFIGILVACLLLLLTVLGFNYFGSPNLITSTTNTAQINSIAVIPFENQNPETEYLSDGLTDSLINNLTKLPNLRVISRNSSFQYKNKKVDLEKIKRELNVNVILTGRLFQDGNNLIVTAELTDLRDGRQIWGQQFTQPLTDTFALQRELSQNISENLSLKLTSEQRQLLTKRETDNPDAFLLYLKGRYYWNKRTAEDFQKAIVFFNQAIEKDPTYALAYVGLANSYVLDSSQFTEEDRWTIVKSTINKALEIDENLGEAYAVLAINDCFHKWDWASAERAYRRAIELNPNYATARHWYAELLAMQGRFDESFAEYDRALELDPLSLAIKTDIGYAYFFARQYDRAIEQLQKVKKLNPDYARTYLFLYFVYQEKEMFKEAITEFIEFYRLTGTEARQLAEDKISLENALKTSDTNEYRQKMLKIVVKRTYYGPVYMAALYAKANESDEAFEYLEQAYSIRNAALAYLKVQPEFDNLRSDPRFIDLMRRVGIP